ncbi:MAG TPA: tetratricopeptide repeat protein [Drouetiella sp.]
MIRRIYLALAALSTISSAANAKDLQATQQQQAVKSLPHATPQPQTAKPSQNAQQAQSTPQPQSAVSSEPKSFHDLVKARKFAKAEKLSKKTLQDANRLKKNDPHLEQTYEDVAQCYIGLQKFDDARPYFLNVLKIEEKKNGPDSPKLLTPLNNVVRATCAGGACYDTIPYLQRMLSIRRKTDPNSSDIPINLLLIGEAYEKKEKFEPALDYFRQAVLAENKRSPHSPMSQALERNIDRVQHKLAARTQHVD